MATTCYVSIFVIKSLFDQDISLFGRYKYGLLVKVVVETSWFHRLKNSKKNSAKSGPQSCGLV
jgi:hypothetical protein